MDKALAIHANEDALADLLDLSEGVEPMEPLRLAAHMG
jgi:hypothetical protein